jgi:hypothetical protein
LGRGPHWSNVARGAIGGDAIGQVVEWSDPIFAGERGQEKHMRKFNLGADFNRFAGKEVDVIETVQNTKYGRVISMRVVEPSPIVDELRAALDEAGFSLRLWLPGFEGTSDHRTDRVNVSVNKDADGKYRIDHFDIG